MFFLIYGTDHFRCQEKIIELKKQFQQKRDQSGLNVVNLDGAEITFDAFKQEILTTPFLGEKKLIIIKNLNKNRSKKINGEILDFLKKNDKSLPNAIIFAEFLEKKEILKSELFNYLKKKKTAYPNLWELNLLSPAEIEKWLKSYLTDKKVKIEGPALKELISLVGNDLQQLLIELDKLIAYSQGNITRDDVLLLVKANFDDNIFALIDAISNRDKKLAIKLLNQQLQNGSHPLVILSLLTRQFKLIIQIKNQLEKGHPNQYQLAKNLGLAPFIINKAMAQAKNFSLEQLLTIYNSLIELDYGFKSGKDPELIYNLFILKNC